MSDISSYLFSAATWLVPLTMAIVCHEVAHGWAARMLGDETASREGRLSLNPLRHVDPVGTVILPMSLALAHLPVFGWARPVPVDDSVFRDPKRDMAMVALAGPAMNLVLALLSALVLGLLMRWQGATPGGFLQANVANFIIVNLALAVFNLLPVPPFDGSRIVGGLLPDAMAERWRGFDRYGLFFMIGLLVLLPMAFPNANLVERIVGPPVSRLANEADQIAAWIAQL